MVEGEGVGLEIELPPPDFPMKINTCLGQGETYHLCALIFKQSVGTLAGTCGVG